MPHAASALIKAEEQLSWTVFQSCSRLMTREPFWNFAFCLCAPEAPSKKNMGIVTTSVSSSWFLKNLWTTDMTLLPNLSSESKKLTNRPWTYFRPSFLADETPPFSLWMTITFSGYCPAYSSQIAPLPSVEPSSTIISWIFSNPKSCTIRLSTASFRNGSTL